MRRTVLGIVAMAAALASGAAEACRGEKLPKIERFADADVVAHVELEAREPGPQLIDGDPLGTGESAILILRVHRTYVGEHRPAWEVMWRLGGMVRHEPTNVDWPQPHYNPALDEQFIAALVTHPTKNDAWMNEIMLSGWELRDIPFLMSDFCGGGAAYLFPYDAVNEERVLSILGEKT